MNHSETLTKYEEIRDKLKEDEKLLLLALGLGVLFFACGSWQAKNQSTAAALIFYLLLILDHLYLGYLLHELILYIRAMLLSGSSQGSYREEFPEVPVGEPLVDTAAFAKDAPAAAVIREKNNSKDISRITSSEKELPEKASSITNEETEPIPEPRLPSPEKQALPIFKRGLLEEFDLYGLCRELCEEKDHAYPYSPPIAFRTDRRSLRVYSDKSAFLLIFRNALDNERKFLNREDKVEVTMSVLKEKEVLIIFRDNGTGAIEANPNLLFSLNYQGRNKKGGTGLGLSQLKAITEEWGGSVSIKTSPGNGFALYVQMPFEPR